jgi:prophage regulatory protein
MGRNGDLNPLKEIEMNLPLYPIKWVQSLLRPTYFFTVMDMICAERTPSYHIGVHQMNALNSQTFHINQILNIKQLIEITGLSRATIYSLLDPKSKYYDASFPQQIHLTSHRVGWVAHEVNTWIAQKISNRGIAAN